MSDVGFFEDLVVTGTRRVVGEVRGLRILRDANLVVQGVLRGAIQIEDNSAVSVSGQLDLSVVRNEGGTLTCAGQVTGSREQFDSAASFDVAVGSFVNDIVLLDDGTLRPPGANEQFDAHSRQLCLWSPREQRFKAIW
ncbi:hypothetical protein [Nocardioides lacusdianchii]|uniref:hypothetical protein n=1 Tax=Nocardioides lacusdianchii TaxID=2783664 RepID=UPI001CC8F4B5|nr:hypothetical protein [Nocardioides lacusdianchii]